MASPELTQLSKNLATQNGVSSPTPTLSPGATQVNANQAAAAKLGVTIPGSTETSSPVVTPPVKRTIQTPTVAPPKTTNQIQADLLKASQGEIDAINTYASQKIEALKPTQDQRVRETSSVNTLTGLAGSSEANVTTGATRATNDKENQMVRAEAAAKIQTVMSGVKTKAIEMAQSAREQFTRDTAEARAQKTASLEEAVKNAATLAASGVTYDGLKTADPESYQYLADAVGGEELLKAQFTLNRPQEDILDKKIEGGKYVIAYRNPLTGTTRIESVDLGLPPQYTKTVDAGNRILAIPDNWDGDVNKLLTINKGLTPGQQQSGITGTGVGSGLQLSSAAQNILEQVNLGANLDDLIKGTSNAAQALRNEVLKGLNAQGGTTEKSLGILTEGKAVVDSLIDTGGYKALGGYSTLFGGKYTTAFGDAKARTAQLEAILARDNLGLLKGAMSDKDLAFIQSMSSGFQGEGIQSEEFIKTRLEEIQAKLKDKIASTASVEEMTDEELESLANQ